MKKVGGLFSFVVVFWFWWFWLVFFKLSEANACVVSYVWDNPQTVTTVIFQYFYMLSPQGRTNEQIPSLLLQIELCSNTRRSVTANFILLPETIQPSGHDLCLIYCVCSW